MSENILNTLKPTRRQVVGRGAALIAARGVLRDKAGRTIATGSVPGLAAPLDLRPKSATVSLRLPKGAELAGGSVAVEAGDTLEITKKNNTVRF